MQIRFNDESKALRSEQAGTSIWLYLCFYWFSVKKLRWLCDIILLLIPVSILIFGNSFDVKIILLICWRVVISSVYNLHVCIWPSQKLLNNDSSILPFNSFTQQILTFVNLINSFKILFRFGLDLLKVSLENSLTYTSLMPCLKIASNQ